MAGLQLSGLASGLDWLSLVDKLMEVSALPQSRLTSQKNVISGRSAGFSQLSTALNDLQTASTALKADGLFQNRSAAIGNKNSTWTSTAASGTAAGTYNIAVTKLATTAKTEGTANIGQPIAASSDVSGVLLSAMNVQPPIKAGDFTVDGQKVTVALTDTLQDVFAKISTATGGTVTASYDPGSDAISLSGSGSVMVGSSNDTSNFLLATKLYNNGTSNITSATSLGSTRLSGSIATSGLNTAAVGDGSGNGTFKINGVEIQYNVNSDSIQNVITRINGSTAGVTAAYDSAQDRFILTNKSTGDVGLFVEDTSGNLMGALGVTGGSFVRGSNAEFSVNGGGTLISNSNTLDEGAHGITGLSVTATTETTETITIGADTSAGKKKIEEFIAKFNAVQSFIDTNTKITTSGTKTTTSLLSSYREVSEISRNLRDKAFAPLPGATGTVKSFSDMGIDFNGKDSQLVIKDATKLQDMLANKSDEVAAFFNDATNGLVAKMDSYIKTQTGTNGAIPNQISSMTRQMADIDTQVSNMQRRLDAQRAAMEANFTAMETAQSKLQSQLAQMQSALGLNSTSTSK